MMDDNIEPRPDWMHHSMTCASRRIGPTRDRCDCGIEGPSASLSEPKPALLDQIGALTLVGDNTGASALAALREIRKLISGSPVSAVPPREELIQILSDRIVALKKALDEAQAETRDLWRQLHPQP